MNAADYKNTTAEMTPKEKAFYDLMLKIDHKLGKILGSDEEPQS